MAQAGKLIRYGGSSGGGADLAIRWRRAHIAKTRVDASRTLH